MSVIDLTSLLTLTPTDPDLVVGQTLQEPWGRVFGGQVLAQALRAAQLTVEADRPVHSMHAYFLRPGTPGTPIEFAVERLRDGRSFSARRTHALQDGVAILSMIASFQSPSQGLDHQQPMDDVPPPEELPTVTEYFASLPGAPEPPAWMLARPIELRHVEGPLYVPSQSARVAHQGVWMRAVGELPDDPQVHAAVLAYASDYSALEPALRRHGLSWTTPGLRAASLDHAMWWHRPARADQWLLYLQESPSATGARGLGIGRIYTREGSLVASVAQEGMLRVPSEPPEAASGT